MLIQVLERAVTNAEKLSDRDRRYLDSHRTVIGAVLDILRLRGPVRWRSQDVPHVSAMTGLTGAESALVLAGLLIRDWDEDEFLSPPQLSLLDVTVREAQVGRMELLTVPIAHRVQILDAAMPDQAAARWEQGPDIGRLCSTWNAVQGHRVPVREDLLAELGTVMGFPTDILRTFTSPSPGDWLHNDGESQVNGDTVVTRAPTARAAA